MPTYLLVTITVRDPSWVADYTAKVPAIVQKHGGEYLVVSENIRRFEGSAPDPDGIVLFSFPSMDAIEAFLADPAYAPYKAARLAGSTADMLAILPRA